MTIKELLRQYRTIDAEITDIKGRYITEPELSDIFDRELGALTETRRKVEEYISNISDSLIRYIFRLRYIDGLSWDELAAKLTTDGKGSFSSDMLKKIHSRYIRSAPEV